jgi:hypothetical protein
MKLGDESYLDSALCSLPEISALVLFSEFHFHLSILSIIQAYMHHCICVCVCVCEGDLCVDGVIILKWILTK